MSGAEHLKTYRERIRARSEQKQKRDAAARLGLARRERWGQARREQEEENLAAEIHRRVLAGLVTLLPPSNPWRDT